MFGMLDYRAYKLFWLINLPIRLAQALIWHGSAAIAALLANLQFTYPPLIKGIIAYGGFQLFWIFGFWLLFIPFTYVIKRIFFWVIDVVPAHGANAEEAMAVATLGPAYELNRKFDQDIEHWTEQDTNAFVALSNWRQRWLYPTRGRMNFVADELRQIYQETGKQPNDLDKATIEAVYKSFPGAKRDWVEKFITSPYAFNEAINIAIIVATLFALR